MRLANGNTLIASRTNEVLEVTPGGKPVWSYTRLADNPTLLNVYSAQRLPNGNTLIVDRRADFVIEVTPAKEIVWRYGAQTDSLQPGSLYDPFSAVRLANGNTLIVDNRGGTRVIEVRSSDYGPADPALGYTADSIVWQYGRAGDAGIGTNQLASPRFAQRLANGNTLITDAGDQVYAGHRVIEVTPGGDIVWQYGVAGEVGRDLGHLDKPAAAQRLANGNTLIVEETGPRMLEVDGSGSVVDLYAPGEIPVAGLNLGTLRSVNRTSKGSTVLSDQGNQRVVELGYPLKGSITSDKLWLGLPGVRKTISKIEAVAELPPGTSVSLAYSLDGGAWRTVGTTGRLPAVTIATQVRYRVGLATTSAAYSPVLRQVRITFDVAPLDLGEPEQPAGGGTQGSGGTTSGSGTTGTSGGGATGTGTLGSVASGTGSSGSGGTGSSGGSAQSSGSGPPTGSATSPTSEVAIVDAEQTSGGVLARGTLLQPVASDGSGAPNGVGTGQGAGGEGQGAPAGGWFAFLALSYLAGTVFSAYAGSVHTTVQMAPSGLGRS